MREASKRIRLAWVTIALFAGLACAAPVHASDVKAACLISGETKAGDKFGFPGVPVIGGKGLYSYGGSAACVGLAKGQPIADIVIVHASGAWNSVVCGTGKVEGTIVNVSGPPKYHNLMFGKKFAVHFIGTAGLFFWESWRKPTLTNNLKGILETFTNHGAKGPDDPANWQLAGSVNLGVPTAKPPSVPIVPTFCTKAFSVSGVVLVDH